MYQSQRTLWIALLSLLLAVGAWVPVSNAAPAPAAPAPQAAFPGNDGRHHRVSADKHSLMIDGGRVAITSGEFHYWRLPSPHLWRDIFEKMKAGGFNAVSLYFHWGFHSQERGKYDFSGIRDIDRLLTEAKNAGLYVIARPGPYIQAESNMGGLAPYMTTHAGLPRTAAPDNLGADLEWLHAVNTVIGKHQITDGGGSVIAYQVENEMITALTIEYQRALQKAVKADGITVPLFHNDYGGGHGWFAPGSAGGELLDLYAFDYYPLLFNCGGGRGKIDNSFEKRIRGYSPKTPVFIAEGQGGAFTSWGRKFQSTHCNEFVDESFVRQYSVNNIANGVTLHNTYMEFGGTNWGWLGDPGTGFTSYDYGAAISENRALRPKFATQKEFNYLQQSVPGILTSTATKGPKLQVVSGGRSVLADMRQDALNKADSVSGAGVRVLNVRHNSSNDASVSKVAFPLDVAGRHYPRVPQEGALVIGGRDATSVVIDHQFGSNKLLYTTGQLAGTTTGATSTMAITAQGDSETVLRYDSRPQVDAGGAQTHWDETNQELRINHHHGTPATVTITSGDRKLVVLLTSREGFQRVWQVRAGEQQVLTDGADLVRSAALDGSMLKLRGDVARPRTLRVWTPAATLSWNGQPLKATRDASGALVAQLEGPAAVAQPKASGWRASDADPERLPGFDDSKWTPLTKKNVPNLLHGPGWAQQITMDADEYGFSHGDLWYRGTFTPSTGASTMTVSARTGTQGMAQVWLNGEFVGSQGDGPKTYALRPAWMEKGKPAVVSIVVRNNGHTQDPLAASMSKHGRGLWDVALPGAGTISWRMQGAEGGVRPIDVARGAYNNGGSFAERSGWHLPGAPVDSFKPVGTMKSERPGMRMYRSGVQLDLPAGQDTAMAVRIADAKFKSDKYRAVVFLNGWNVANYINHVGPQQEFVIPAGMLNPNGRNELAVLVTAEDAGVGPDAVTLVPQASVRGGLPHQANPAGDYKEVHR